MGARFIHGPDITSLVKMRENDGEHANLVLCWRTDLRFEMRCDRERRHGNPKSKRNALPDRLLDVGTAAPPAGLERAGPKRRAAERDQAAIDRWVNERWRPSSRSRGCGLMGGCCLCGRWTTMRPGNSVPPRARHARIPRPGRAAIARPWSARVVPPLPRHPTRSRPHRQG
jgi:hypothetical protein